MVEGGPWGEKGPPRESRRGEGGGGGSPPFFGCGPNVPARRVIQLNETSRFRHKGAGNDQRRPSGGDPAEPLRSPVVLIGGPSFWFTQLGGTPQRRPALPGSLDCDVVVVGAGYTGLWTAYYLKQADPALRVVVLEREFAGYGASGRNGGWLAGAISGMHDHASVAAARETVDEVGRVVRAEGIECAFHKGGALAVATGATQLERLREHPLAHGGQWLEPAAPAQGGRIPGAPGAGFDPPRAHGGRGLEPAALAERVRIAGALGAVFAPEVARVQPAALVRGLAAAVERLGVPVYEGTAVTAIEPRVARTAHGDVRAAW